MIAATVERTASIIGPITSYDFTTAITSIRRTTISVKALKIAAAAALTIGVQLLMMAVIFHYRESLSQLDALAYPGVALAEFGNSAMILLPTPWPAYTIAMSVVLNPLLVGLVGGLAAAAGEMVGYVLGCRGRSIVSGGRIYALMQSMSEKYGDRAIFLIAVMPVPFDIAGIWAGTVRYPVLRFFVSVAAGKIIRITIASTVAHYGIKLLF